MKFFLFQLTLFFSLQCLSCKAENFYENLNNALFVGVSRDGQIEETLHGVKTPQYVNSARRGAEFEWLMMVLIDTQGAYNVIRYRIYQNSVFPKSACGEHFRVSIDEVKKLLMERSINNDKIPDARSEK